MVNQWFINGSSMGSLLLLPAISSHQETGDLHAEIRSSGRCLGEIDVASRLEITHLECKTFGIPMGDVVDVDWSRL